MRSAVLTVILGLFATSAVAAVPTDPSACRRGGRLYFSQRLFEKAIEQFECAVQGKPEDAEAWLGLANSYCEVGRFQDAAVAYAKADSTAEKKKLKEDVANNREHYWGVEMTHGMTLVQKADKEAQSDSAAVYQEALTHFDNALLLDANKRQVYIYRGYILSKLGRGDESVGAFEQAVALPATDDESDQKALENAKTNLQAAYKQRASDASRGETVEELEIAAGYYEKVLAIDADSSDVNTLFGLANVHYQIAKKDSTRVDESLGKAAELYEKVLEKLGDDEDTLYNLTLVYIEKDAFDNAQRIANKLIAIDPKKTDGHNLMRIIYARRGDSKSSLAEALVVGALEKGTPIETGTLEDELKKSYGPSSDALAIIKEKGKPDEARSHDAEGIKIDTFFYWSRGEAVAFSNGNRVATVKFEPVTKG